MNLFHDWFPKDWRAAVALVATIIFGMFLGWFAWDLVDVLDAYGNRLITELVRDPNVKASVGNVLNTVIETLAWGLKLLIAGLITVILSLGLAVNRRSIKINKGGIDLSGGDDAPLTPEKAAQQVADAAQEKADEIPTPSAPATAEPGAAGLPAGLR